MNNMLQMLTTDEVASLLHMTKDTITMLRENKILLATKTGRNYMYSQESILNFQRDYAGLDVSNYYRAIESREVVEARKNRANSTYSVNTALL